MPTYKKGEKGFPRQSMLAGQSTWLQAVFFQSLRCSLFTSCRFLYLCRIAFANDFDGRQCSIYFD